MTQDPHAPVRACPHQDGTVLVTGIGKGWVIVPRHIWDAFTADVKNGDYDHH